MVDWERVGSIDGFDLDSVMDREERFSRGFMANKGPVAVVVGVVVIAVLSFAFFIPISSVSASTASSLSGWTKNVVDTTPAVIILGLFASLVTVLLYMKFRDDYDYEGGASL